MLSWANRFNIFCFLDNADYSIQPHQHDCLLAAGVIDSVSSDDVRQLDAFFKQLQSRIQRQFSVFELFYDFFELLQSRLEVGGVRHEVDCR